MNILRRGRNGQEFTNWSLRHRPLLPKWTGEYSQDFTKALRLWRNAQLIMSWEYSPVHFFPSAFRRLHSAHSFPHFRITSRPAIIQYRADKAANVWFVPAACFLCSWKSLTINFVTHLFRGRIIGYLTSYAKNFACFKRPSERINPSSSRFGFRPSSLLLLGSGRPYDKVRHSSRKYDLCVCLISWTSARFSSSATCWLDVLGFWQFSMNRVTQAWILFNFNQLE